MPRAERTPSASIVHVYRPGLKPEESQNQEMRSPVPLLSATRAPSGPFTVTVQASGWESRALKRTNRPSLPARRGS